MPVVDVNGPTGLSKDQKRTMIKRITDALRAAGLFRSYLGEADPKNPLASSLYGDLGSRSASRLGAPQLKSA